MPLSTILSYKSYPLPSSVDEKQANTISETLAEEVTRATGEAVGLAKQNLPSWYYLLLYKALYPHTPEIVVEMEKGAYLVVHSVYANDQTVTRPHQVHLLQDLFDETMETNKKPTEYTTLNLSSCPQVTPQNIKKSTKTITSILQPTHHLILSGNVDPATTLITLAIGKRIAKKISYQLGQQLISLF